MEQQLLDRYGPLLTLDQLAEVLHRSPKGLSFTLARPGTLSDQINGARIKLGRRVYFRTSEIASALI
jgi:hypothetical protein